MLTRIVRFALCHRRLVVASWLVLLVAGAAAAASVAKRLTFDFALPGEPGYETAKRIERTYDNGGAQAPSVLVATVPRGETVRRSATAIGNGFQALTTAHPELRIVDYRATHDERFITRDGRTTFALMFAPRPSGFGSAAESTRAITALRRSMPGEYTVAATGL